MQWISITVGHLDTAKAAALVTALRTAALGNGQADPLLEIIDSVTARIRMEIAAGGRTRLSVDSTKIPPSLKSLALRLVIADGQQRLNIGNALELSEDDREAIRRDIRLLERIAKGEITVESPDDPEPSSTMQSTAPSPMVSGRKRTWGRDSQDGV